MMTMMMMMMVWMLRSRKMMLRRKTGPKTGEAHFERTCAIEMHWTCHNRHFVRKFTGKMPDANLGASILCEPAQSKCTWTCHDRHLLRKFTGKMPDANPGASICASLRSRNAHGHVTSMLCGTGKMPDASDTSSIEHKALTPIVKNPSVWTHCLVNDKNHEIYQTVRNSRFLFANDSV